VDNFNFDAIGNNIPVESLCEEEFLCVDVDSGNKRLSWESAISTRNEFCLVLLQSFK
jgi:hypothetical protein